MTHPNAHHLGDLEPKNRNTTSTRSTHRQDAFRRPAIGGVGLAVAALGLTGLVLTSPASAATPAADAAHHYDRSLFATDGVAADDVWAVGLTPGDRAAVRHWDGTAWAASRHPASAHSSVFFGVAARTSDDAWAVGSVDPDGTGIRVTYAQHWDGSRWRAVTADPGLFTSEAKAVDALGADDAWIVGDAQKTAAGYLIALAEHWDGSDWESVPTAKVDPGCDAVLSDVTAIAADDVWAAGRLSCDGSSPALLEHWDGTRWSRVKVPSPRQATSAGLDGITAITPDDIWAVGFSSRGSGPGRTMTLHSDGSRWSLVPSPNPGDASCNHGLAGVSGSGSDDVWAAGTRSCSDVTPEMLRWDGTRWSATPIPPSGFDDPPGDGLFDVVSVSKQSAVTVGIAKTRGRSVEAGFIEHWNGRHWSLD